MEAVFGFFERYRAEMWFVKKSGSSKVCKWDKMKDEGAAEVEGHEI